MVISLAIMAGWILAGLVSNPLGILLVAIPLIILRQLHRTSFTMSRTRNTVSLWRQKAGIAYSDNLLTSELDEDENYTFPVCSSAE